MLNCACLCSAVSWAGDNKFVRCSLPRFAQLRLLIVLLARHGCSLRAVCSCSGSGRSAQWLSSTPVVSVGFHSAETSGGSGAIHPFAAWLPGLLLSHLLCAPSVLVVAAWTCCSSLIGRSLFGCVCAGPVVLSARKPASEGKSSSSSSDKSASAVPGQPPVVAPDAQWFAAAPVTCTAVDDTSTVCPCSLSLRSACCPCLETFWLTRDGSMSLVPVLAGRFVLVLFAAPFLLLPRGACSHSLLAVLLVCAAAGGGHGQRQRAGLRHEPGLRQAHPAAAQGQVSFFYAFSVPCSVDAASMRCPN